MNIPPLSTWGTAGNGYRNQEGHVFLAAGLSDDADYPYLFEAKDQPGHTVAGKRVGYGTIETKAATPAHLQPAACYVCGAPEGHHSPAYTHTYWSNEQAAADFAKEPQGPTNVEASYVQQHRPG